MIKSKSIYFLFPCENVVAWHRINIVAKALSEKGHRVFQDNLPNEEHLIESFATVIHYARGEMADLMINIVKSQRHLAVVELDDNIWDLPKEGNPNAEFYTSERVRELEHTFSLASLVTVSTEPLAQIVRKFNPNVAVLPNMLLESEWTARHERNVDKIVIGWGGSPRFNKDLFILKDSLMPILEEFSEVELRFIGDFELSPFPFPESERIKKIGVMPVQEYQKAISQFDIGVAPLEDNPFNRCKSDLKFLEYSMVGIPTVASKVYPYEHTVVNGETGFLARNTKDWIKYLRRLTRESGLRESMGERARHYVLENRTMEKNIWRWEKAYGLV